MTVSGRGKVRDYGIRVGSGTVGLFKFFVNKFFISFS